MNLSSKLATVTTVLLASIACDQVLKQTAKAFLQYSVPISYLGDFIRLQYAENRGIMLSMGANFSDETRFWVFTVAVGFMLLSMLLYVVRSRRLDRMQTIAWSLVVSGGLGNFIDRLFRNGVVIDFISIGVGVVRTAVFNLADVLVFAGVLLLLIHGRKQSVPEVATPSNEIQS